MKKLFAFSLVLSIICIAPNVSYSDQYWAKTYGGNGPDDVRSIHPTADGGYILVGETFSFDPFGRGIWVIKLKNNGDISWDKSFEELNVESNSNTFGYSQSLVTTSNFNSSSQQTADGGSIIAGNFYSMVTMSEDILIIKLDEDGEVMWQKDYDLGCVDYIFSIQQNADEGYVAVGSTDTTPSCDGLSDIWLMRLGNNGEMLWQRTYPFINGLGPGGSFQQTSDGGYVIASGIGFEGIDDTFVMKLDNNGDVLWQKMYSGSDLDVAHSIRQNLDGGYIMAGWTRSFGDGGIWVLRLGNNGDPIWQKTYTGSNTNRANSILQTADGGFIMVGDASLIKLDNSGNIQWQKNYGSLLDYGTSIFQTSDGDGYVFAGNSTVPPDESNIVVMKLDMNGEIPGCTITNSDDVVVSDISLSPLDFSISPQTASGNLTDINITPIDTLAEVTIICTWIDSDDDGIPDDDDNCPQTPNGPELGTCYSWSEMQGTCTSDAGCGGSPGSCSMANEDMDGDEAGDVCDNCRNTPNQNQEDTYPPQGNGIGDVCDCESDFNCDGNVDATDVTRFLPAFGRIQPNDPCTNVNQCSGDFNCDGNVDAPDVTKFLEDFGRNQFNNPCPACEVGDWCLY